MNIPLNLLLIFSSSALLTYAADCPAGQPVVFCYYSNWAIYRLGEATFSVDDIDPSLCTHLIYAFAGLNINGGIGSLDTRSDFDLGGYANFTALKQENPCLKTLLAIGGWNQGSKRYSVMVSDPGYIQAFVDSVIRFLVEYDFDGIDIDWEYPTERGGVAADKDNFGSLMKTMKETLKKWNMLLTIAVPISTAIAENAYDMNAIEQYVDYVLIMGYDFTATDSDKTGLLSPLPEIKETVTFWTTSVPSNKIVLGVPAYGRSFTLKNKSQYGLGAETTGPGVAGMFTQEPGFLNYLEVMSKVRSGLYKIVSVPDKQNYYAYRDEDWIVYETADNLIAKGKYAKDNNLAGAMVWSIDSDDFKGHLNASFAVVHALRKGLGLE